MLKKINATITKHPLTLVMAYAIIVRLFIVVFYQTISLYPDSEGYIVLGNLLTQLNLENYSGNRTPGYPLLIALANNNLTITIFFQLILGILGTYFIFDFTKKNTNKITAFWVALIITSFVHFLFYEFIILTESLTLFLVVFSFWIINKYELFSTKAPKQFYLLLSIIFSWLYLTRPMFIYFTVGFGLFYLVKHIKKPIKNTLAKCLLVALIPLLTYFSWNNLNKQNIGHFTNTAFFGINLSQVATKFFHKAPEKDKTIRDIFVKNRDSLAIHKPEHLPMSIWYAYEELKEKTQLSEVALSNELGSISKNLFKKHPKLYLKQVTESFVLFFGAKSTLKWNYKKFKNKYFKYSVSILWRYFQYYLLILFNILFLIFSFKTLYMFFKSKCSFFNMNLFIVCIVISGALAQAIVTFGANSRFAFPFFPLIVYFVIINVLDIKLKFSQHNTQ